ncbi:DNA-binding transcriptional regulator LsrR, DeoR family [Microlunatus flavus]|uniref:DNA-binding transcriptional regulator LsrR, DeoR family n=1 Tax=Microlunatus flavus TaxID=1036181 RepID=A0A1H9G3N5_9ACTN|nr:DNA-binding transcriptional regulator LsrR, DeoR family [Microlunatus flavus]
MTGVPGGRAAASGDASPAEGAGRATAGPSSTRLAVAIARAYYLEGRSKVEIAKQHDLSRFKVARILEESLASGLVRIEIADVGSSDTELAEQLRERYQLHRAVVVNGPFRGPEALRPALGSAAADLLAELVTADDVLGVGWGRTLSAMVDAVHDLPACEIVQLTGIAGSVATNNADLVRQLLSASHGAHHPLYAPLVVPDAQTAAGLARQPSIKATMAQWRRVSVAVVAVGSWDADGSQLYPVLEPRDHAALRRHSVAAEMCAVLYDPDGRPLTTALDQRRIGISHAELVRVPEVVAVAGGPTKAAALRSVLRGRVVTSVVTDADAARELLAGDATLQPAVRRRPHRA